MLKSGGNISSIAQPRPALGDPLDSSPPGSSVHGILQLGIQEWVAISSSRGSFWTRDRTHVSRIGRRIPYPEPLGRPAETRFGGFPTHAAPHNGTPGPSAYSSRCFLPLANQCVLFSSPPKCVSSVSVTASHRPLPGNAPCHLTPQSSV